MRQKNEVYSFLKEEIISSRIKQGEPIKEIAVAEKLNVSRTQVREALRDLAADGLVDTYQFQGSFVSRITAYDVQEIFELRKLLEVWSLRRSLSRISDEELAEVRKAFQANEDWDSRHAADRALHALIVEKSGSKRAAMFLEMINAQVERLRVLTSHAEGRMKTSYEEHMRIIGAMEERDLEKACRSLEEHLDSIKNNCLQYMAENAL